MKIQKTISVDLELWQELQNKTENCSSTINELIKSYLETTPIKDTTQELKIKIIKLQAKLTKQEEELAKKEKEIEKSRPIFKMGQTEY